MIHPGVWGRSPSAGRGEAGVQRAPAEGECTGTMRARRAGGTGAGSPQTPFGRRRPTGSWARAAGEPLTRFAGAPLCGGEPRAATLVGCVVSTSSVGCHLLPVAQSASLALPCQILVSLPASIRFGLRPSAHWALAHFQRLKGKVYAGRCGLHPAPLTQYSSSASPESPATLPFPHRKNPL